MCCSYPRYTKNILILSSKENIKSLYAALGDVHFSVILSFFPHINYNDNI